MTQLSIVEDLRRARGDLDTLIRDAELGDRKQTARGELFDRAAEIAGRLSAAGRGQVSHRPSAPPLHVSACGHRAWW